MNIPFILLFLFRLSSFFCSYLDFLLLYMYMYAIITSPYPMLMLLPLTSKKQLEIEKYIL